MMNNLSGSSPPNLTFVGRNTSGITAEIFIYGLVCGGKNRAYMGASFFTAEIETFLGMTYLTVNLEGGNRNTEG